VEFGLSSPIEKSTGATAQFDPIFKNPDSKLRYLNAT